jgi:hypothetical protein
MKLNKFVTTILTYYIAIKGYWDGKCPDGHRVTCLLCPATSDRAVMHHYRPTAHMAAIFK